MKTKYYEGLANYLYTKCVIDKTGQLSVPDYFENMFNDLCAESQKEDSSYTFENQVKPLIIDKCFAEKKATPAMVDYNINRFKKYVNPVLEECL